MNIKFDLSIRNKKIYFEFRAAKDRNEIFDQLVTGLKPKWAQKHGRHGIVLKPGTMPPYRFSCLFTDINPA